MIIINEKKGWFGSFSEAGKRAAKMNILLSKDELSKQTVKKKKGTNSMIIAAFESSESRYKPKFISQDDELDIFSINEPDKVKLEEMAKDGIIKTNFKMNEIEKANNNENNLHYHNIEDGHIKNFKNNLNDKQKFFYHDLHMKKRTKKVEQENPPCTKYNPRYNAVLKRSLSTPKWKTVTGRKDIKPEFDHPFYLQHENIEETMAGKSFIDMKKQTLRKSFIIEEKYGPVSLEQNEDKFNINDNEINSLLNSSNLKNYSLNERGNSDKKITRKKSSITNYFRKGNKNGSLKYKIERPKSSYNNAKMNISSLKNINNKEEIINKNLEDFQPKIELCGKNLIKTNESEKSNDSFELYKQTYIKMNQKKRAKSACVKDTRKEIIKAPDFNKIISREHLNKLDDDKVAIVPYLLPNFKSVREKPIMMVIYDKKKHKINRVKSAEIQRIDNTYYYDPNNLLDKFNNHNSVHPPNFKLMTSRPDDNDPLPSYMKKVYNKSSCYSFTSASLKSNNYSNRGFTMFKSSFWPKLSFNKIINLNLLKSKKFLNNVIGDQNLFSVEYKKLGKALKFYNKNYDEILKEDILSRFDNVTFKAIDKQNSRQIKELMKDVEDNNMKKAIEGGL